MVGRLARSLAGWVAGKLAAKLAGRLVGWNLRTRFIIFYLFNFVWGSVNLHGYVDPRGPEKKPIENISRMIIQRSAAGAPKTNT